MDDIDRIFESLAESNLVLPIFCLYSGRTMPEYCEPMYRIPSAPIGGALDSGVSALISNALELNPAYHDGAVMVGRSMPSSAYMITGWSFRLFPPPPGLRSEANRGSAFNSCLAMSVVPDVDRLYYIARQQRTKFAGGSALEWGQA